jgi:hypothetical protein
MIEDMPVRGFKEDTRRDYVRHAGHLGWICTLVDRRTPPRA